MRIPCWWKMTCAEEMWWCPCTVARLQSRLGGGVCSHAILDLNLPDHRQHQPTTSWKLGTATTVSAVIPWTTGYGWVRVTPFYMFLGMHLETKRCWSYGDISSTPGSAVSITVKLTPGIQAAAESSSFQNFSRVLKPRDQYLRASWLG